MLVRNARRSALSETIHAVSALQNSPNKSPTHGADQEPCDAPVPCSNESLEAENDALEVEATSTRKGKESHDASRTHRRSTSAYNRTNGLIFSATYLTATYGGAPAIYSLWLGEPCSSTVVVHLQCVGDSHTSSETTSARLRLSCDRLEFAPHNFAEPQLVRVELVEPSGGTHVVLHRVFSLDSIYDRLVTPNVVIKTERSSAGSLLVLDGGGALVHKRTNTKDKCHGPRRAATRTIDISTALAASTAVTSAAAAAVAAFTADTDGSFCNMTTTPLLEAPPVFVSHMAAGHGFSSLVVKPQSGVETVLVWGMNTSGELGIGSTTPMVEPVVLPLPPQVHSEPTSVLSVACGKHHAALVTTHGRLFTWGHNKHGQLGLGDFTSIDTPREVTFVGALFRTAASHPRALRLKHAILDYGNSTTTNVTQVACGAFHTLFVTHQQHVLSMGYNQAGQLGLGHRLQQRHGWRSCTPAMVETLHDGCILDIAAGQNHSVCVLSNGDVYVWGCGSDGRLGVPLGQAVDGKAAVRQNQSQNLSECEVLPVPVRSLKDMGVRARTVRCGARHTAIVSDNDLLYVWGANEFGQLGLSDKRSRTRPCLVEFQPFLSDGVVDVSLGEFHSACVTWSGDAYVWGLDLSGEQSTRLDQRCAPELVALAATESAVRIACGWTHTTVLTQASRELVAGTSDNHATHKLPVHVHRRKEKALKFSTRQQEVAKWRHVSTALGLLRRLPRRGYGGKQSKAKKRKSPFQSPSKLGLASVVSSARKFTTRDLLREQERDHIKVMAETVVTIAVEEAIQRAIGRLLERTKKKQTRKEQRPASTPGRRVNPRTASPPQGVFYQYGLHLLVPPTLPPPCFVPPASSPRHMVVHATGHARGDDDCPWSPTPPSPRRRSHATRPRSAAPSPRAIRSPKSIASPSPPTPQSLTASCASLLSALQDDNPRDGTDDKIRPPTLATPRVSRRLNTAESLFHTPSFSLASHLVGGGMNSRSARLARLRHPYR